MVVGLQIDYVSVLITVIHDMGFKSSTTYPLACLIFHMCRKARVSIMLYDTLRTLVGIVDICLIRYEANVADPRRGI